MLEFGLLIIGLIGLWQGTKLTLRYALQISKMFNLSETFVGVAVLAVGTDLPETFISITSSIHRLQGLDTSGMLMGNAIGSSICQISLILGLTSLFVIHRIERKVILRDGLVIVASISLAILVSIGGHISRLEGILLLLAYIGYYLILARGEAIPDHGEAGPPSYTSSRGVAKLVIALIIGLSVVVASSELVVQSGLSLAKVWGVRQSFVGIILIGLGTSLPELSVSIGAAVKKSQGLAIGNILGSNIYDVFVPIGLGAAISPLKVSSGLYTRDLPMLLIISVVALVMLQSKKGLQRREALGLIFIYIVYGYWKWGFG